MAATGRYEMCDEADGKRKKSDVSATLSVCVYGSVINPPQVARATCGGCEGG